MEGEAAEEEGVVVPATYSSVAAVAVAEQGKGVMMRSGPPFLLLGTLVGMALEQAG